MTNIAPLQKDQAAVIASFTSKKLDWLKCVNFDHRLQPYDFKVAYVLAQHANEKTGRCNPSDDLIAIVTGGRSVRSVLRSRDRLNAAGWIDWERTGTSNRTTLLFKNVERVLDQIVDAKDKLEERRIARRRTIKCKPRDTTRVSYLGRRDATPVSGLDTTRMSDRDVTPVSYKHLKKGTPSKEHPSEDWHSMETDLKGRPAFVEGSTVIRLPVRSPPSPLTTSTLRPSTIAVSTST